MHLSVVLGLNITEGYQQEHSEQHFEVFYHSKLLHTLGTPLTRSPNTQLTHIQNPSSVISFIHYGSVQLPITNLAQTHVQQGPFKK